MGLFQKIFQRSADEVPSLEFGVEPGISQEVLDYLQSNTRIKLKVKYSLDDHVVEEAEGLLVKASSAMDLAGHEIGVISLLSEDGFPKPLLLVGVRTISVEYNSEYHQIFSAMRYDAHSQNVDPEDGMDLDELNRRVNDLYAGKYF